MPARQPHKREPRSARRADAPAPDPATYRLPDSDEEQQFDDESIASSEAFNSEDEAQFGEAFQHDEDSYSEAGSEGDAGFDGAEVDSGAAEEYGMSVLDMMDQNMGAAKPSSRPAAEASVSHLDAALDSMARDDDNDARALRRAMRVQPVSELVSESQFATSHHAAQDDASGAAALGLSIADMVSSLRGSSQYAHVKERMKSLAAGPSALAAPSSSAVEARAERKVAYQAATEQVDTWEDQAQAEARSKFVSFPHERRQELATVRAAPTAAGLASKMTPSGALEVEIAALLDGAGMADAKSAAHAAEDDLGEVTLTAEDMRKRQAELAKLRAMQSYDQAKRKQLKKIKSKAFHRVLKREKTRAAQAELDRMKEHDPAAAQALEEDQAMQRAQARMTLRHQARGKWLKRALAIGGTAADSASKESIEAHLARAQALAAAIHARPDQSDEDSDAPGGAWADDSDASDSLLGSSDEEVDSDVENTRHAIRELAQARRQLLAAAEQAEADAAGTDGEPAKGLHGMKFMSRAKAADAATFAAEAMANAAELAAEEVQLRTQLGVAVPPHVANLAARISSGAAAPAGGGAAQDGAPAGRRQFTGSATTAQAAQQSQGKRSKAAAVAPGDLHTAAAHVGAGVVSALQQPMDIAVDGEREEQGAEYVRKLRATAAATGVGQSAQARADAEQAENPWLAGSAPMSQSRAKARAGASAAQLKRAGAGEQAGQASSLAAADLVDASGVLRVDAALKGLDSRAKGSKSKRGRAARSTAAVAPAAAPSTEEPSSPCSTTSTPSPVQASGSKRAAPPQPRGSEQNEEQQQQELVQRAFAVASEDIEGMLQADKLAEAEATLPASAAPDMPVAGWGSWAGQGSQSANAADAKAARRSGKRWMSFESRVQAATAAKEAAIAAATSGRRDAKTSQVMVSTRRDRKFVKHHQVPTLPHGFESRAQFERAQRQPLGPEWNTAAAVQAMTRPEVRTKAGQIIAPMRKAEIKYAGDDAMLESARTTSAPATANFLAPMAARVGKRRAKQGASAPSAVKRTRYGKK